MVSSIAWQHSCLKRVAIRWFKNKTGNFRPESSVFSLFMNGSSFLSGLCTYFRFRQVQHYQTKSTNINHIWKLNVVSLLFSIISSIGLLIVANFQEAKRLVPITWVKHAHRPLFYIFTVPQGNLRWIINISNVRLYNDILYLFVIMLKYLTQRTRTSDR